MDAEIAERVIRKTYSNQLKYLQVAPLIGLLYQREVIGRTLKEQIEAERDPVRKRTLLLDSLSIQPLQILQVYCSILEKSAATDCIYIHGQIAKSIRDELEKLQIDGEVEKDSSSPTAAECFTASRGGKQHVVTAGNSNRMPPVTHGEHTQRELTAVHQNNNCQTAPTPADAPITLTPCSNSGACSTGEVATVSTAQEERLDFVHHMYGCFDYVPEAYHVLQGSTTSGHEEQDNYTEGEHKKITTHKCHGKAECQTGSYLLATTKKSHSANSASSSSISSSFDLHYDSPYAKSTTEFGCSFSDCRITPSIKPVRSTGPLKSKTHRMLVEMLWNMRSSEPQKAKLALGVILGKQGLPLDIRVACIDAGLCSAPDNLPRLQQALANCDSAQCANPLILKCRLHLHIANCHLSTYIGVGGRAVKEHYDAAFALATQIERDHSAARAIQGRIWRDFEDTKHTLTQADLERMSTRADQNLLYHNSLPEWMKRGLGWLYLCKAFLEVEKSDLYRRCNNVSLHNDSLKSAQRILKELDEQALYLDPVNKAYYYHIHTRMALLTEDAVQIAQCSRKACGLYLQNYMFQRALQVAGQVNDSELEQWVKQTIKARRP